MKKTKVLNFFEWNNKILINSIKKINLSIILIIILDALFYFLSGYLVIFWLQRIQEKITAFNLPADIVSLGYEKAQQLLSQVKMFYYLTIFSFVLLLIIIIFLASILKGIIWAKTTNTKINFILISKFFGLNLIWMGFWFALVFLIPLFVEQQAVLMFTVVTIVLGLYLTNTLYTLFMKKQALKSILDAIKLNITKIHLFLLPYAIILLLLFIIIQLSNLLTFDYSSILFGLIIVIYAAVIRYYVSTLVTAIQEL